jgi:hypothetical protein
VAITTTARERPYGMKVIHVWAFVLGAHSWTDRPMRAVIGRVTIKPDRADEALAVIGETGVAMLRGHDRLGWWLLGAEPRG